MFEQQIHSNPKSLYDYLQKENIPALWLNDFNAWLVCDRDIILKYSSSVDTTSKRNKLNGVKFRNSETEELQAFFADWLMYDDGQNHQYHREIFSIFLKSINVEKIKTYIKETIDYAILEGFLHEEIQFEIVSESISIFLQSSLFNLPYHETKELLNNCSNIVRIIGLTRITEFDIQLSYDNLQEVKKHKNYLINSFDEIVGDCNISRETKFHILCNLLLDGNKSLVSGINNCVWLYIKEKDFFKGLSEDKIFEATISQESPFQQISRLALKDIYIGNIQIKKGEKMLLSIGAYNHDSKQNNCPHRLSHISFGYGKHYCIGARISKIIVSEVLAQIRKIENLELVDIRWEETIGYRSISNLTLKRN